MRYKSGLVRKLRHTHNLPGHAHELTFSCHRRLPLLSRDRTREWFIEALNNARNHLKLEVWAYVIMPEHAHVLIFPKADDYSVPRILKAIKQPVSQHACAYLRRNAPRWLERLKVVWPSGRVEHRFWAQGGGYDRNVVEPKTALASIEYIHNNPVRRGLVQSAAAWPWSSASWYAGEQDVKLQIDNARLNI